MNVDPGMPRKVLRRAHELGVHNDCLIAATLCDTCHISVMSAFDHFYGHCKNEAEVIGMIIDDFRRDMAADIHQGGR